MNYGKEKNNYKPKKQQCIVCKRFVVHPDRKFLVCLDCLILKLIQIDKTRKLFQLLKESAKE